MLPLYQAKKVAHQFLLFSCHKWKDINTSSTTWHSLQLLKGSSGGSFQYWVQWLQRDMIWRHWAILINKPFPDFISNYQMLPRTSQDPRKKILLIPRNRDLLCNFYSCTQSPCPVTLGLPLIEAQNHKFGKNLVRSSSPTIPPTTIATTSY